MQLKRKKTLIRLGLGSFAAWFLFILIFFLEYTVWNFSDSDLPPYQPDTPFENLMDGIWWLAGLTALFLGLWFLWVLGRGLFSMLEE